MKTLIMGSFDPLTLGHQSVIERALAEYDDLTVCVMVNEEKKATFSLQQRVEMLNLISENKFKTDCYQGWCYEYCKINGIELIIRGFRNSKDYAYETEMAIFNKAKCGVKTELVYAGENVACVSSSEVKHRVNKGLSINEFIDSRINDYILNIYNKNRM